MQLAVSFILERFVVWRLKVLCFPICLFSIYCLNYASTHRIQQTRLFYVGLVNMVTAGSPYSLYLNRDTIDSPIGSLQQLLFDMADTLFKKAKIVTAAVSSS